MAVREEIVMTTTNRFINARVELSGHTCGADDGAHWLFEIAGADEAPIYGEYIYAFYENGNDFNIEIDQFGFSDYRDLGHPDSEKRQRFSAEEAAAAEQLIRAYFLSKPEVFPEYARALFRGGVAFRPKWILYES